MRTPLPYPTKRQLEIWDFILSIVQRFGLQPTIAEIARHVGLNHSTVHGHMKDLKRLGWLQQQEGHKGYVLSNCRIVVTDLNKVKKSSHGKASKPRR